jgi:hypothetical protein
MADKFCTVAPNTCGSSVRNLLHVTLPARRILRWLLDFLKICAPLLLLFKDTTNFRVICKAKFQVLWNVMSCRLVNNYDHSEPS